MAACLLNTGFGHCPFHNIFCRRGSAALPSIKKTSIVLRLRTSSQIEWQLVEIHIAGDCADLGPKSGNLVGEHARSRNLDRIVPVVVVVAECIREVQNRHLRDL